MKASAREKAIWLLRAAADILEQEAEEVLLPGWDPENESDGGRCASVREAAKAITGEDVACDGATAVSLENVGLLVRYIGDMLEE
jgi:hypothetical protein